MAEAALMCYIWKVTRDAAGKDKTLTSEVIDHAPEEIWESPHWDKQPALITKVDSLVDAVAQLEAKGTVQYDQLVTRLAQLQGHILTCCSGITIVESIRRKNHVLLRRPYPRQHALDPGCPNCLQLWTYPILVLASGLSLEAISRHHGYNLQLYRTFLTEVLAMWLSLAASSQLPKKM